MKSRQVFFFFIMLSSSFYYCTKNNDERDEIIGKYTGIEIDSYWSGVDTTFNHDTFNITMTLEKASADSIIQVIFNSGTPNSRYLFKYYNTIFKALDNYHPPQLRKSNDSLFFYERPGLGPSWTDAIVKKI
jgi:hypothetical protein